MIRFRRSFQDPPSTACERPEARAQSLHHGRTGQEVALTLRETFQEPFDDRL